jgi:DNA-binding GntR family transcriptional regulator
MTSSDETELRATRRQFTKVHLFCIHIGHICAKTWLMPRTSSAIVYNTLKAKIISGELLAGTHLREEELAVSLGCSRTPVREAIRQLEAEGLIEFSPHRGARVTSWTDEDISQIFHMRLLLEGRASRLAAERIEDYHIEKLEVLATEMERICKSSQKDRFTQLTELNNAFHGLIHEASLETMLVSTLRGIVQVAMVKNTFSLYSKEQLQRSMNHHRELIAALEHKDPEWAEAVMHCHIRSARWVIKPRA